MLRRCFNSSTLCDTKKRQIRNDKLLTIARQINKQTKPTIPTIPKEERQLQTIVGVSQVERPRPVINTSSLHSDDQPIDDDHRYCCQETTGEKGRSFLQILRPVAAVTSLRVVHRLASDGVLRVDRPRGRPGDCGGWVHRTDMLAARPEGRVFHDPASSYTRYNRRPSTTRNNTKNCTAMFGQ